MRSTARLWAAFVAGGTLLLVTSCTSSTADGPTTTTVVSMTVSPSVVDPSTPTSSSDVTSSPSAVDTSTAVSGSSDISPQEAADRAAIEAQWVKFWNTYQVIVRTAPNERRGLAEEVAVPALAEKMANAAEKASSENKDNYGQVIHHIFWQSDVAGQQSAVIGDCLDQSQAGTVDTTTGAVLTVGPERTNMRGQMQRGDDGVWRVESVISLNSSQC